MENLDIEHRVFWETLSNTNLNPIDNAIDVFSEKTFGDIIKMEKMFQESKSRGFSAELKESEIGTNVKVMLYFITNRIMVTLKNEHGSVTIVGSSSPKSKPGLQSINCRADQALDMLKLVTSNWKMLFNDSKKVLQTRFKKDSSLSII